MSNTPICLYPWFHQRVDSSGIAIPCCNWSTHNNDVATSYKDFFYSNKMQSVREEMLAGKIPLGCQACIEKEKIGCFSQREIAKEAAYSLGFVYENKPSLIYQEIDYSNLCNLRCKMCNSERSYKLAIDEKLLDINPFPRLENNWTLSDKDLLTVKLLRFLGGEPLLHQDKITYELNRLKEIDRLSELTISINSNMMVNLTDDFLHLLSQCKAVWFTVSIDAYGDLNSYIRTDSDWNTSLNNILFLKYLSLEYKNITYQPIQTISILNCNKLNELYKFMEDEFTNMITPQPAIYVTDHWYYDIKNLPLEIKHILLDRYNQWIRDLPKWNIHVESIKNILSSTLDIKSKPIFEDFNKRNSVIDRRCKFKFEDVNKEMHDWLNQFKNFN